MENNKKEMAKNIAIDTLKGGFGVVLPTFGMLYIIVIVYNFILGLLDPLTKFLANFLMLPVFLIDFFSLFLIISLCFVCGIFLKTKFGQLSYNIYEVGLKKLKVFKIFNIFKEIYNQFFNKDENEKSFSEAVIAFPYGRKNAGWSGLISNKWKHKNIIYYSIFFPTCPNFTSGVLMHVEEKNVDILEGVEVDEMMRTVISCGYGTKELLMKANYIENTLIKKEK